MTNVLITIKELLGISDLNTSFDNDVTVYINTALLNLKQLGVIKSNSTITITTDTKWDDLIKDLKWDENIAKINLESIKTYLYLKSKIIFDPPTNPTVFNSFKETIKELEWRLLSDT